MTGPAKPGTAGPRRRAVFAADKNAALAELVLAWADGGYHGFSADDGTWSAISSAGDVLTGDTPVDSRDTCHTGQHTPRRAAARRPVRRAHRGR